jgi:uncharacterized zinc-type alcohol dehydrogenase-like protein
MVDSCGECAQCRAGFEQFCHRGAAFTYNSTEMDRKTPTQGGYSTQIVVTEKFALTIPAGLDPAGAAPLMCAGVTTWAPLREHRVEAGQRVAVVGLGGLGHMGVKLARSLGTEVTVFSTSPKKEEDARRLGATDFVATRDPAVYKKLAGRFDFVLDTLSAPHDLAALLSILRPRGTVALVGASPEPLALPTFGVIGGNKRVAGSLIGGIRETQEMLDHCAKHGIVADVETIAAAQINEAYDRMVRSDVRYRFVIDAKSFTGRA